MIKHCVICGAEFSAPQSSKRDTCSRECWNKYGALKRTGKPHPWSDSAKDSARRAATKTQNIVRARAAAISMPESQRGEQHRLAKAWQLISPDGELVTVLNLHHWAREHATDYFGLEPTDKNAARIASGIRMLKYYAGGGGQSGGKRITCSNYKGWQLVGWGDGNTTKKD